jgi:3-hydroxy-9,10-secoandrosta-1,3,5(10)-triene-9,17-dione monooxygenase
MQRYLRDVWMYRTHIGAQYDPSVRRSGAGSLGDPQSFL